MRHVLRVVLLMPLLLGAADAGRAQERLPVFGFARTPSTETQVPEAQRQAKLNLTAGAELKVRPNTGTELYLWVRNPTENDDTFFVELTAAGGALSARTKAITIPGNTWVPVALPKATPPAPPAPAAPPSSYRSPRRKHSSGRSPGTGYTAAA